jgi:hypothetical protein
MGEERWRWSRGRFSFGRGRYFSTFALEKGDGLGGPARESAICCARDYILNSATVDCIDGELDVIQNG